MNYYDSSIFCQFHENATLPKITSSGVQDFLHGFIYDYGSDIWLGLVCTSYCMWWDFTVPTYTNYVPGEPSFASPIIMRSLEGQWQSHTDYWPIAKVVVCEKPARNV